MLGVIDELSYTGRFILTKGVRSRGMAKIQLTIKTDYLPKWDVWEGIRELVQNGRDAEIEHGAPLTIDWYNDTLRIENTGTTLELKALLLGHTSKVGRGDMIGQFGEGLKLGILALVRKGIDVKIRNGSEVWLPKIEFDEKFEADVLTFHIEGGREFKNRVRVEIGSVSKETWDTLKELFLFISTPKKGQEIKTPRGSLLLGETYKSRVYVKGIFVQKVPGLAYGYNLIDAELDRDRKMVEFWNLRYKTQDIFALAVAQNEALVDPFCDMLSETTIETEGLDEYAAGNLSEKLIDQVAAKFTAKYGADAIPVQSLADSKDIEHLGKTGVVVSKQLAAVLSKKLGDTNAIKESLKKEVRESFGWHDLNATERQSLQDAVALVNKVEPISLDQIDVVDFRSDSLFGQFSNGRVLLAKKILADADETLATIVHEVAHRKGGDGDHSHVNAIENLWKAIVKTLRAKA